MENLFGFSGGRSDVLIDRVVKPYSKVEAALIAWHKFQRALAACDAEEKEEVNNKTWVEEW